MKSAAEWAESVAEDVIETDDGELPEYMEGAARAIQADALRWALTLPGYEDTRYRTVAIKIRELEAADDNNSR